MECNLETNCLQCLQIPASEPTMIIQWGSPPAQKLPESYVILLEWYPIPLLKNIRKMFCLRPPPDFGWCRTPHRNIGRRPTEPGSAARRAARQPSSHKHPANQPPRQLTSQPVSQDFESDTKHGMWAKKSGSSSPPRF